MARSRSIKPSFFSNDVLATLSPLSRLLFIGLWTLADRLGRLEDRPTKIKAQLLPYDRCKVEPMLKALHDAGFILRYAVSGLKYIQILAFERHQSPHVKELPSSIPAPDEHQTSPVLAPENPAPESLVLDCGLLTPDCGLLTALVAPGTSTRRVVESKTDPNPTATALAFTAYASAYSQRYGSDPVRNAKVMGQMSSLVKRLGKEDAAFVAAWFVRSDNAFYVTKGHSVGVLLADAEKLRTEWATGRSSTVTEARMGDRTAATGNVFKKLIEEAENAPH